MSSQRLASATFIGQVSAVRGGEVSVKLRSIPTTLVMVNGESHRIGQIGSYVRIPLGYTQLYGVCTQVGADPDRRTPEDQTTEDGLDPDLAGHRWITVALFGESNEGDFERGVGQYPTVGDEVHLATVKDTEIIHSTLKNGPGAIRVGHVSGAPSVDASLDLAALVTRHACVVGSTGSGKSNLMAVLLRSIADAKLPSARVLVVDPHGEYFSALGGEIATLLHAEIGAPGTLRVPFWALSFDNLTQIAFGPLSEANSEHLRDRVRQLKLETAALLSPVVPPDNVSADSPIPFSLRRLWHELRFDEDATYSDQSQTPSVLSPRTVIGDPEKLIADEFPPAALGSGAPFLSKARKGLSRSLEFLHTRLLDPRFSFMFSDADDYHPDLAGKTKADLDSLMIAWLGSQKPVTVLDVSGVPSDVITTVVGSLLGLIYETLFWGMKLPTGGKRQPLLVVIDEAHRFLPSKAATPTSTICARIAREGRKYGMGLMVVTQRPSDIDPTILSQCGSMISLRITNRSDRAAVASTVPDDLGDLVALLPSLRTGECLVLGEALQVPSRIRVDRAPARPVGDDPKLPSAWLADSPSTATYKVALDGWRAQQIAEDPNA